MLRSAASVATAVVLLWCLALLPLGIKAFAPTAPSSSAAETSRKNRSWDQNHAQLEEFYKEHGHADVPTIYMEDPRLGRWVRSQRVRKSCLSPERIEKLTQLNFRWEGPRRMRIVQRKDRRNWDESYAVLEEFYKENGHSDVPNFYDADPKLGHWVAWQRRSNRLSTDKMEKLDKLDFTWQGADQQKYDQKWKKMFQQMKDYKVNYGDCCVPQTWELNQKLANWVATQRKRFKGTKLSQDRVQKLESIGFVWNVRKASPQV